jgi:hypothetical protein
MKYRNFFKALQLSQKKTVSRLTQKILCLEDRPKSQSSNIKSMNQQQSLKFEIQHDLFSPIEENQNSTTFVKKEVFENFGHLPDICRNRKKRSVVFFSRIFIN